MFGRCTSIQKNEVSRSRLSKVRAQTGQTDTQTQTHRLTDETESITVHFVDGNYSVTYADWMRVDL